LLNSSLNHAWFNGLNQNLQVPAVERTLGKNTLTFCISQLLSGPVAQLGLRRRPSEPENEGSNPSGPADPSLREDTSPRKVGPVFIAACFPNLSRVTEKVCLRVRVCLLRNGRSESAELPVGQGNRHPYSFMAMMDPTHRSSLDHGVVQKKRKGIGLLRIHCPEAYHSAYGTRD
jgi:hypothetical protein